jgi:copper resistance protein C
MTSLSRLLVAAALLASAAEASAHAFLDHATPAVGSALRGSPDAVNLWFTQELEAAFSTVKVVDRDGKQVDNGDKTVAGTDRAQLRVSLPPLPPGTYRVRWRVLSIDTHVTEGDFTFEVQP